MVVPVPKTNSPKILNEFKQWPVQKKKKTKHALDLMQFSFVSHRTVVDATVTLLNQYFKHLENVYLLTLHLLLTQFIRLNVLKLFDMS